MSSIQGTWFPKDSAEKHEATLVVEGSQYVVYVDDENNKTGLFSELLISHRLGNTERKLTLVDGSVFATRDNQGVDELQKRYSSTGFFDWLHRQEASFPKVICLAVLTLVLAFSFFRWGVPWTSEKIAHALPHKTNEILGKQSLRFIDKYFFEPSHISNDTKNKIKQRFKTRLLPLQKNNEVTYKIHFRNMKMGGEAIANAFALPSGDIILTDEFVRLSRHDDEIDSVLLHEMGHVVHRHSLEMVTQSSMITILVMLILGNPDGVSEIATGLGTALVNNHYSRKYEKEADFYAFEKMLLAKINPNAFVNILSRMEHQHMGDEVDEIKENKKESKKTSNANSEDSITDYLSTHPATELRIEMAKKYEVCFKQGRTTCSYS